MKRPMLLEKDNEEARKLQGDYSRESPSAPKRIRHPVTQDLIDDILAKELKELSFCLPPVYNSQLKGNTVGITSMLCHLNIA
jgi:hypothetical protein